MMTLQARLTLVFALLTTLTAGLAAYSVGRLAKRQLLEGVDFRLDSQLEEIEGKLKQAGMPEDAAAIDKAIR